MPHPIIEISELAQVIVDHCLILGHKQSLVSLACACRALEVQALSALWSEQSSLTVLIKSTLPPGVWSLSTPLPQPTKAEWDRFRRYASWIRRLYLNWNLGIPEAVFRLMSLGLSGEVLCPGLRQLFWSADFYTLQYHRLLLSPKLTLLLFSYSSSFAEPLERELSIVRPLIMELDTFPLQDLYIQWQTPEEVSRQMVPVVSSAVLQCGPALKRLLLAWPLSDAAVQHIMQLPNLDTWYAMNGPPPTSDLPPSDIFPQLHQLTLETYASLGWLIFFTTAARRRIPSGQNPHTPPDRGPVDRLRGLRTSLPVPIDAVFMSLVMQFRQLTTLKLGTACPNAPPTCAFGLTDENVADIAAALPHLQEAILGTVCSVNSCRTTVASLVSLSTRCKGLEHLGIHFNTTNLRSSLESVSGDPRLDGLPSLRTRDGGFCLWMSNAPYKIVKDDIVPVLKGFRRIFPSLTQINGDSTPWKELDQRLREV
ncbi:hypothetical protein BJ322DRAFT_279325 [Thelephora terrestris]|uniref:Uncharacterized protein n=1 Tax=Thelephora terrestris TaxID=56493 RepID=A0A9P6H7F0_9AGAM|nr:hypothetical protein BJ322DRAFT_279325 [Thelephora terrestris]